MTKVRQAPVATLTVRIAIREAIDEIDNWPGEFRIEDVLRRVRARLGVQRDKAGVWSVIDSGLYARVRRRLGVHDEFGHMKLRRYVCYSLSGQRSRNWLKLDHATVRHIDALLHDRTELIRDNGAILPVLQAALPVLETAGPAATFADVRATVLRLITRAA